MATKTVAQRKPSTHVALERDRAEQIDRLLARAEDNALDALADFTDRRRLPNLFSADAAGTAIAAIRDIRIVRKLLAEAC